MPTTYRHPLRGQERDLTHLVKAIRRIVRAVDLHSRQIDRTVGLTLPQLVVMTIVERLGQVTVTAVSEAADLSPATVVGILDKLEEKQLLERYRSTVDRRIVHTRLTAKGRALLSDVPPPLGHAFAEAYAKLSVKERSLIVEALEKVAALALRDFEHDPPIAANTNSHQRARR